MQLGAGGVFAIFILKEVFNFLKTMKKPVSEDDQLQRIEDMVKKMHDLHNVVDEDGVPVWYVRKSMEASLTSLDKTITRLSSIMDSHYKILERIEDRLYDKK